MKKRILAMAMAIVLCLGLMGTAFASGGQKTVHASTEAELEAALKQSNTKITLDAKDYNVEPFIYNVSNVTIEGTDGTRIISDDETDTVFFINECQNISLVNLVVGHDNYITEEMDCVAGVLYICESTVNITNCDLFGCGLLGLAAEESTVTVKDSTIRDCSRMIAEGFDGNATFTNCTFSGNGYKDPAEYALWFTGGDTPMTVRFDSCTFKNNKNKVLATDYAVLGDIEYVTNKNVKFVYNNCTFSGNAWGNDNAPAAPAASGAKTANPTASNVLVNGEKKAFGAYNIDGSNYFKLRDLAYVLNGSEKQFEVGWDSAANAISLTSGKAYTTAGGEMAAGGTKAQSAAPATAKILVDGKEVSLTAYNIGGNNYFKLRDVGEVFDFGIGWDAASSTITIDTSTGYTA